MKFASNNVSVLLLLSILFGCKRSSADEITSHDSAHHPVVKYAEDRDKALNVSPSKLEIEKFVSGKAFRGKNFPENEKFEIDYQWHGYSSGIDINNFSGIWSVEKKSGKNNALCVTITEQHGKPNFGAYSPKSGQPFCRTVNSLDQDMMSVIDPRRPEYPYEIHVRTDRTGHAS